VLRHFWRHGGKYCNYEPLRWNRCGCRYAIIKTIEPNNGDDEFREGTTNPLYPTNIKQESENSSYLEIRTASL